MRDDNALLTGVSVLLVEDQPLIAMDIEEMLIALGASSVMVASSIEEARAFLASRAVPDLAVLDFAVGNEYSTSLAVELRQRRVAVAFVSGYDSRKNLTSMPVEISGVPFVDKPVDPAALAEALLTALAKRSQQSSS